MKHAKKWLAVLLLSACSAVMALDIDGAKAQGLVGEQPDGYLGVVKSSPEAVSLANDINAKRRAAYEGIAKKNGATLEQVATVAGQKAIEKSAPGSYVKDGSGKWLKK